MDGGGGVLPPPPPPSMTSPERPILNRVNRDCHIHNFHGTASSNRSLMEDQEQEEKTPEVKDLEELPTMQWFQFPFANKKRLPDIDFVNDLGE